MHGSNGQMFYSLGLEFHLTQNTEMFQLGEKKDVETIRNVWIINSYKNKMVQMTDYL